MMVTLLGAVVSDALEDGQVVSGVGGQFNFVAQAFALDDARAVIVLRATRETAGRTTSNIRWSYGHVTIPRHLRDIVVTEYGVADLRGKTDRDVIAAILAVADSASRTSCSARRRRRADQPGFDLPAPCRDNTPARIASALAPARERGLRRFRSAPISPPSSSGSSRRCDCWPRPRRSGSSASPSADSRRSDRRRSKTASCGWVSTRPRHRPSDSMPHCCAVRSQPPAFPLLGCQLLEPDELEWCCRHRVDLSKHILHAWRRHEFLYAIHLRGLQFRDDVNPVPIVNSAKQAPPTDLWWWVGFEQLDPVIKVFEAMNSDKSGHCNLPLDASWTKSTVSPRMVSDFAVAQCGQVITDSRVMAFRSWARKDSPPLSLRP